MNINKVTLYSIEELEKFIINNMCINQKIRMVQCVFCKEDNKLFTILIDSAFTYNKEFLSLTIIDRNNRSLIPCLIDRDSLEDTLDILNTIMIITPKDELGIDSTDKNIYIECIYHDRIFFIYDQKKDTLERYHQNNPDYNQMLRDQLNEFFSSINIDDLMDDDDDDEYNV